MGSSEGVIDTGASIIDINLSDASSQKQKKSKGPKKALKSRIKKDNELKQLATIGGFLKNYKDIDDISDSELDTLDK